MTNTPDQWSPARAPYAIAVSQSWWAFQEVLLFASQAAASEGTAQQIFAQHIFGALRKLRRCAAMQSDELRRLGIRSADQEGLRQAIGDFDAKLPAVKPARDILEHFDEYARGVGKLQRELIKRLDLTVDDAAAMFWGGGYDPVAERVTQGPFAIVVPEALNAAQSLHDAIYAAGKAVDRSRVTSSVPALAPEDGIE